MGQVHRAYVGELLTDVIPPEPVVGLPGIQPQPLGVALVRLLLRPIQDLRAEPATAPVDGQLAHIERRLQALVPRPELLVRALVKRHGRDRRAVVDHQIGRLLVDRLHQPLRREPVRPLVQVLVPVQPGGSAREQVRDRGHLGRPGRDHPSHAGTSYTMRCRSPGKIERVQRTGPWSVKPVRLCASTGMPWPISSR